jgi:hypothetical protein
MRNYALCILISVAAGAGVGLNAGDVVEGLAAGSGTLAVIIWLGADVGGCQPLYRTHYLSLGTIFGAGLGVLCGLVVGNMALFGLGVGVGTSTGMAMEQFRGCVPGNGGG